MTRVTHYGWWVVFGVIRLEANGQSTWYSIKNKLPNNFFTRIAISPTGEVWIGGKNNALFRLEDGEWVDEGIKPLLFSDDRKHYLYDSTDIAGIDFTPDGSVWVMNAGIEIYRRVYGQWINVPFPKQLLRVAGDGGVWAEGIRVKSADDITIKLESFGGLSV